MKNIGETRIKIAEILNKELGANEVGTTVYPDDIIKRSGGSRRMSKYDLATSSSWSAFSKSASNYVQVSCVGLTMQEFIKEYQKGNIVYRKNEHVFTFYKDDPIWKADGYVVSVDKNNGSIVLNIADIWGQVCVPISKHTPKWLYEEDSKIYFTCKIYFYWRRLQISAIEGSDWTKVWKTFKQSFLSQWEIEDKYYDRI